MTVTREGMLTLITEDHEMQPGYTYLSCQHVQSMPRGNGPWRTYAWLRRHAETLETFAPTREQIPLIAAWAKLSERTIRKSVQRLLDAGIIRER